jgi:hypothetical protein
MTTLRWIDTSHPQKWIIVLPALYTSEELFQEFGEAIEALRQLPRDRRIVVLTDLTKVGGSDSRRRQRIAQIIGDNRVLLARHIVAWGFVASGIMRGALTALSWIRAFPVPMSVFSTRRECEAWIDEQLAAATRAGKSDED